MSKHDLYLSMHREYCDALFSSFYFRNLDKQLKFRLRIVIDGGLVVNLAASVLIARGVIPTEWIWLVFVICVVLVFRSWVLPSKSAQKLVENNSNHYSKVEQDILNIAQDIYDKNVNISAARDRLNQVIISTRDYSRSEPLDTGLKFYKKLKVKADHFVECHADELYIGFYGKDT